jgi:hypothetical protein
MDTATQIYITFVIMGIAICVPFFYFLAGHTFPLTICTQGECSTISLQQGQLIGIAMGIVMGFFFPFIFINFEVLPTP